MMMWLRVLFKPCGPLITITDFRKNGLRRKSGLYSHCFHLTSKDWGPLMVSRSFKCFLTYCSFYNELSEFQCANTVLSFWMSFSIFQWCLLPQKHFQTSNLQQVIKSLLTSTVFILQPLWEEGISWPLSRG